jgi:hypothetical protein
VTLFINRFNEDDFYIFDESDSQDSQDSHDLNNINELNKTTDYEVINLPDAKNMVILKPKNENIIPYNYKIPIILKDKIDLNIKDTISNTIDGISKNASYNTEEKLQKNININVYKKASMYEPNNEISQVDQVNKIYERNFIIFQQAWNNDDFINPNKDMCEVLDLCNTADQLEFYINNVDNNKMN